VNILHNFNTKNKEDKIISEKTSQIFYYIGVYCSYKSYLPIIMAVLRVFLEMKITKNLREKFLVMKIQLDLL